MLRSVLLALALVPVIYSVAAADDELDVKKTVRGFLDALDKSDPKAYEKFWAAEGKVSRGRQEAEGKHDVVMDRATADAVWSMLLDDKSFKVTKPTAYQDVVAKVDGDTAELSLKLTTTKADLIETGSAKFNLRKEGAAWKIQNQRSWPLKRKLRNDTIEYSAESLEKLDGTLSVALMVSRSNGPPSPDIERVQFGTMNGLVKAHRWKDAHEFVIGLTDKAESAGGWYLRGNTALMAGKPDEARAAYQKALQMDPKLPIPKVIRDGAK